MTPSYGDEPELDNSAPLDLERYQYLQPLVGKLRQPLNQDNDRDDLKNSVTGCITWYDYIEYAIIIPMLTLGLNLREMKKYVHIDDME